MNQPPALSITPKGTALGAIRRFIFVLFLGTPSLESLAAQSEDALSKLIDRWTNRTSNITIVAALAASTTVAFMTTLPPTSLIQWQHQLTYFCISASSGSALLSVLSGLCLIMYLNGASPNSIKRVRTSMFKRVAFAMLVLMPTTFLFFSAFCLIVAWIASIWYGDQTWLKVVGTTLSLASTVVVLSLCMTIPLLQ